MSLTEFSYYFRKIFPILIISLVFFIIIFYFLRFYLTYTQTNNKKEEIIPRIFGKINSPLIKNSTSSAEFSFILDNIEGRPITTTDSAKVYFIPKSSARFGYREKIYLMAKTLGFDTETIKHRLIENFAFFEDENKKLKVDITNFNFTFESDLSNENFSTLSANIPSEKKIEESAVDFLKKINRYPEELLRGNKKIIYIKYDPLFETYLNVDNPNDANLVEVDFFRDYPENIPVVTPNFFNSHNYVIIMFDEENYRVIKSQIAFFEKSTSQYDIYPIKSAELAWEELLKGKGKVVAATKGKKDIVIKEINLAYYDSDEYQSFLQPVYVFLGEDNFVAYIQAIADAWIIQE